MIVDYQWDDVDPYPVTIVQARYSGIYEGGKWLAFPCDPEDIDPDSHGGDITCADYWADPGMIVGKGLDPCSALWDLTDKLPVRKQGEAWPPEVS